MRSSSLYAAFTVLLAVTAIATEPVFAAGRGGGGRSGAGKSGGHRGHHHHHHRNVFGGGVFLGSWYYPRYWHYPGYISPDAPPITYYIERGDEQDAGAGWLYCPGANAYFPTVVECGSGWVRVPAHP